MSLKLIAVNEIQRLTNDSNKKDRRVEVISPGKSFEAHDQKQFDDMIKRGAARKPRVESVKIPASLSQESSPSEKSKA